MIAEMPPKSTKTGSNSAAKEDLKSLSPTHWARLGMT